MHTGGNFTYIVTEFELLPREKYIRIIEGSSLKRCNNGKNVKMLGSAKMDNGIQKAL